MSTLIYILQINESLKINHDYSAKTFDELQNNFVVLFHLHWKCSYKNTDKTSIVLNDEIITPSRMFITIAATQQHIGNQV